MNNKIFRINTESFVILNAKNAKDAIDKFNLPTNTPSIYEKIEENLEPIDIIEIENPSSHYKDIALN